MPQSCDLSGLFGGGAASTAEGGSALGGMLPLLLMLAVFFVLMILPQRRRQKKVKEMLEAIKAGDKIKTIGGFYGKVEMVKGRSRRHHMRSGWNTDDDCENCGCDCSEFGSRKRCRTV